MGARRHPTATHRVGAARAVLRVGAARAVLAVLATCVAASLTTAACSATGTTASTPTGPPPPVVAIAPGTTGTVDLDGRPYRLHVPTGYAASTSVPLVVGLHGFTSRSSQLDSYLGLTAAADARGFLLALPEGTTDRAGHQFWNAVDGGCCDLYSSRVDDSRYLSRLVTQGFSSYPVSRVVVVGHSNGGYMAQRFACDHADQVDAIASLAGPLPFDTSLCRASRPVRVLDIHGDADETVPYLGRAAERSASAMDTVRRWAVIDGCTSGPTEGAAIDLEATIPGPETTPTVWSGCRGDSGVQLWTIHGGRHVPTLTPAFTRDVLDAVLAQA